MAKLDAFRKKRNAADYERAGTISTAEADEIVAFARALQKRVRQWLKQTHPALLSK